MINRALATTTIERATDGTPLRQPERPTPRYSLPKAVGHFRALLKDKENTAEVFKIFEALPSKTFLPRVRALALSERGATLRRTEPALPAILDDHAALRRLPAGSIAHAYCDFMEREGLSAAGLVAESDKLGRPKYGDLVQWYSERSRDTHDLMHILTGYGRDPLGEQCVLLFTHGQTPSHGHLLIGYAGALHISLKTAGKAPILKACRQAQRTGRRCPPLVEQSILDLLASDLSKVRARFGIPEPTVYHECHRVWREAGVDPYDLLAPSAERLATA